MLLYTELNDKLGIADVSVEIEGYCVDKIKVDKAMKYFLSALNNYQLLNDSIGFCYSGIGLVYNYQGDYNKAIEYFRKALKYHRGKRDLNYYAQYLGIANAYYFMIETQTIF